MCPARQVSARAPALIIRLLLFLTALSLASITGENTSAQVCNPSLPGCVDPTGFLVRAYGGVVVKDGGKCLDYTPEAVGSAAFLNDCSVAHPIVFSRLSPRMDADGRVRKHEVRLRVGTKVLGLRPGPPSPAGEVILEVQDLLLSGPIFAPRKLNNQTFVLDGDSIILASDRTRVAKVHNSRGANGSPIVFGPRQLTDSEFWDFDAIDGTDREPTCAFVNDPACGFVHVWGLQGLHAYLTSAAGDGVPGYEPDYDTVIKVDTAPILLSPTNPSAADLDAVSVPDGMVITGGVTIRGDRRGTRLGPELAVNNLQEIRLFTTKGDDIRITGLRIRGNNPGRSTWQLLESYDGIGISIVEKEQGSSESVTASYERIIVDHNDVSDWTIRAVAVFGGDTDPDCDDYDPEERSNVVRLSRNFIHHNLVQGSGYGVNANSGGFPLIDGNTFLTNRHAIAATNSTPATGYRAWSNLVLSDVPEQKLGIFSYFTHDFDVHGTDEGGFGGTAGGYTGLFHNTFLGKAGILPRPNFGLRGYPCQYVEFINNISLQSKKATIKFKLSLVDGGGLSGTTDFLKISTDPNQFNHANPTDQLGVGDFDGDGRQDPFLATGTAWYFAPGGEAEWRLLSPDKTDPLASLRFGDFDADGRTDVIGKRGTEIMVSWGGASEWETLNTINAPITDLAVGNFDGIDGDDIFYADGLTWRVSANGSGEWLHSQTSVKRVRNLRFGDFNGNGTTDVFGVVSGNWSYSEGAKGKWTPLRPALTDTVSNLFVGDFDGNGRDDVATFQLFLTTIAWRFSSDGIGGWTTLVTTPVPTATAPIPPKFAASGRFLGGPKSALLFWDGPKLDIVYVGSGGFVNYSRQDMR
jgi:hypothetical protein